MDLNGVRFMKEMINHFDNKVMTAVKVIVTGTQPPEVDRFYEWGYKTTIGGKHTTCKWRWYGEELLVDNSNAQLKQNYNPVLRVNKYFATAMRWFTADEYGLIPGPNLTPFYINDTAPSLAARRYADLQDVNSDPLLWKEVNDDIVLSAQCNWRFRNLNESFSKVYDLDPRSTRHAHVDSGLFVCSDIVESSLVGSQRMELLREIQLKEKETPHYFEPEHIHYIPVRNTVVDIVRLYFKLAGTDSRKFAEFEIGEAIATLHFRGV